MTLYSLYLRSRVRRELASPSVGGSASEAPADATQQGRQERTTMVCGNFCYSYAISAREEFEAEDDAVALVIARCVYDAARDLCDAFDLWDGTRYVDQRQLVALNTGADCDDMQERIIATEEALRDSEWAVARSPRLRARLKELRVERKRTPSATRAS